MTDHYLLALDFRGTLSVMSQWSELEKKQMKNILSFFYEKGWYIVFASNEDEQSLIDFCRTYELTRYFTAYKNKDASETTNFNSNDKNSQLLGYSEQFSVVPNNIYFFDDGLVTIELAHAVGFINATYVSHNKNLLQHLIELAKKFKSNDPSDTAVFNVVSSDKNNANKITQKITSEFSLKQKILRSIKDFSIRPMLH